MSTASSPLLPRLVKATYWFDEALREFQLRHGQTPVTRVQAMILLNLALGEQRPVRLARAAGVTKQAASLIISDFHKLGWLAVTPDPSDARASLVEFSPLGRNQLKVIFKALHQLESHLADVIGADRMGVFRAVLDLDWGAPPILPFDEEFARSGIGDRPPAREKRKKPPADTPIPASKRSTKNKL